MELLELELHRRTGEVGCPLMLGEDLDKQVQVYPLVLGKVGGVINKAIISNNQCHRDCPQKRQQNVSRKWWVCIAYQRLGALHILLVHKGYVKKKANSKVKITVQNFEELRCNFLCDVMMEEIPSSMILNWDHTGPKYVPMSSWTTAKQGSKKVSIADKRQITGVFTITQDGQFLPLQLMYQGTTSACLYLM